jgi:hypothetical protein
MMDASRGETFFAAPFPSDARRGPDGRPSIEGFPNPSNIVLVERVLEVVRTEVDGFGVSTGIWFRTTRAVDASTLPDLKGSVAEGASVFLLSVDPDAPDAGERYPVDPLRRRSGALRRRACSAWSCRASPATEDALRGVRHDGSPRLRRRRARSVRDRPRLDAGETGGDDRRVADHHRARAGRGGPPRIGRRRHDRVHDR